MLNGEEILILDSSKYGSYVHFYKEFWKSESIYRIKPFSSYFSLGDAQNI